MKEEALQGVTQIAEEMKAIRDLRSLGRATGGAIREATTAIARNNVNGWMRREPCGNCVRRPVRELVDGLVAFQIHTQRAVIPSFLPRPLVQADDAGRRSRRDRLHMQQAEEGARTDGHREHMG